MPVKLETSTKNIQLLDNHNNARLIHEFYLYPRFVDTFERYQNQNIKALINMAKLFEKDFELLHLFKKEDVLSFIDSKIKSKSKVPYLQIFRFVPPRRRSLR